MKNNSPTGKIFHLYGMKLRGFAPGCQPMEDFVDWSDCEPEDPYHSILLYRRELTAEEVKQYDLEELPS
jgi:hypothetical protein